MAPPPTMKALRTGRTGTLAVVVVGRPGENLRDFNPFYYALLGSMKAFGLGKSDANIQAAGPAGVWQLFAGGKAQAMAGTADWIAEVEATGTKVDVHPSGEYFPSMAQAILASDEAIRSRPETVQKVVRATLKGLKYMLDDPKGSVAAFVQAVLAARAAFDGWAGLPVETRAAFLDRISAGLKARMDEMGTAIAREVGMPLKLAKPVQVGTPVWNWANFARDLDPGPGWAPYRATPLPGGNLIKILSTGSTATGALAVPSGVMAGSNCTALWSKLPPFGGSFPSN